MVEDDEDPLTSPEDVAELQGARQRRRWRRVVLFALAGLLLLALAAGWLSRKRIADDVIADQLAALDLPATYTVERIGVRTQVLRDVVVGNPQRPDFTAERLIVVTVPRFGIPGIGRITAVRPRLYGSLRGGKLSFGSLDKLLFEGPKQERFQLPELDVAIIDGRGRLDSDYGPVGFKLEGAGKLRGGFAGTLAAIAPHAAIAGCTAEQASLYGRVTIRREKPRFTGPVRLGGLACPGQEMRLAGSSIQLDTTIDQTFDGAEGRLSLALGKLGLGGNQLTSASGDATFSFRKQALTARYRLTGKDIATPQAALASLAALGIVRSQDGFARIDVEGDLAGRDVRVGNWLDGALAGAERSSGGTLAAPLIAQLRTGLRREAPGSRLAAGFVLRQTGGVTNLVVPQSTLRGGSGAALLALSRLQLTADGLAPARLSGNFTTGGRGLPQIAGRMERNPAGGLALRASMAEYAAGEARLALPELVLVQARGGSLGFGGRARLSGPLPGGAARNLTLPLDGNWSPQRGLAVWRKCTPVNFDQLAYANLTLLRRSITLCPPPGGAILASDARGTRLAAGAPSIDLAGSLGSTPIRLTGGPLGFAWPGSLEVRSLDVALGPSGNPSRFRIANLAAKIGSDVAGRFAGTDVRLAGVPLDILGADGAWRYAGGKLSIADAAFRLEDRAPDDRFQPLTSRDGALQLADNVITAAATLNEPSSSRRIVQAIILHDLASGRGTANLAVEDLLFDRSLQPDMVTRLALGVVANVSGRLRGTGRIVWNPEAVTSTGSFTTDSLDFAAAFGPVSGASGTVEFTDLLGLVTAPNQRVKIAAINPGIEANEGELIFELRPDSVLAIKGAEWPFLGGTLTLEPTRMQFGVAEVRRYTLRIAGLDAAKFVERMDLGNLTATGTFDGAMPLVFDENGGRIAGGRLVSRAPGGNVSYVGALTYKDLSPMANFAFEALKSLNYKQMQIEMDGALEGEIVTRVTFDGVSQGTGAKRNFLTQRIARLPIRFNVNVRAPFFQLVRSFRSLYDPAYVQDPRELGLLGPDGRPLPGGSGSVSQSSAVQPPVSEKKQ